MNSVKHKHVDDGRANGEYTFTVKVKDGRVNVISEMPDEFDPMELLSVMAGISNAMAWYLRHRGITGEIAEMMVVESAKGGVKMTIDKEELDEEK